MLMQSNCIIFEFFMSFRRPDLIAIQHIYSGKFGFIISVSSGLLWPVKQTVCGIKVFLNEFLFQLVPSMDITEITGTDGFQKLSGGCQISNSSSDLK